MRSSSRKESTQIMENGWMVGRPGESEWQGMTGASSNLVN